MESTHARELLAEISELLQHPNIEGIRNALHQEVVRGKPVRQIHWIQQRSLGRHQGKPPQFRMQ